MTRSTTRRAASPRSDKALEHRLRRLRLHGLAKPIETEESAAKAAVLDCGWGRLIFAQTFTTGAEVIDALRQEEDDRRDIAFYVNDPHVLLSLAPQETFLDPSHTYRLELSTYRASRRK